MDNFHIHPEVQELFDELVSLRRQIHMNPELLYDLPITSKLVSDYLTSLGIEVHTQVGISGVVGVINNANGPCILLRADMDCLPIDEANNIPYKSKITGKMHACGHDSHTAMLMVAAKVISRHRNQLKGSVKFFFQPAEEGGHGAREMINDANYPVLDIEPKVDQVYAIHVENFSKLGDYILADKYMSCNSDALDIKITGKGGHMSAETNSPVNIGANLILQLQTILSRNVSNKNRAVVSITSFNAGSSVNTIPNLCQIKGTIRTFDSEIQELVHGRIRKICEGVEIMNQCDIKVNIDKRYQPTENNEKCNEIALKILEKICPEGVRDINSPMIGEDFFYLTKRCPGCYFLLSSGLENSIHSPNFDIDERVMLLGSSFFVDLIFNLLS
ncbi:hypothetical protein SteCoe_11052 [Stentor coeruleus]|uniref:Peptidase M20 dimerisation domain-containing protein n=1 Tax=Stentor coeruleus TaxID=5963 RepID=A0A1R2CE58_9CILI|nr:hypothetical protein SteCoe_11052 [Stentor coeruleus]